MKYRISLCISALCFLTAFLIALSARQQGSEALASRIAPEILRFHILANSDSDEDQQLKMEVKGLVIDYVNENLGENATKETTAAWLTDHSEAIEDMAHRYLLSRGKDYPVSLMLTRDYFPTKAYGDMVFPCGTYDAARITIGSGNGHNWWCVLYPGLCRSACGGYDTPAENDLVCGEYIVRFRFVEWWDGLTAPREDVVLAG